MKNTKNPSLWDFYSYSMQNSECLNCFRNFSENFVINSFEEMEMDRDSFYVAVAHEFFEDCIKPNMREVCSNIRLNDCSNTFAADSNNNLFPRTC